MGFLKSVRRRAMRAYVQILLLRHNAAIVVNAKRKGAFKRRMNAWRCLILVVNLGFVTSFSSSTHCSFVKPRSLTQS